MVTLKRAEMLTQVSEIALEQNNLVVEKGGTPLDGAWRERIERQARMGFNQKIEHLDSGVTEQLRPVLPPSLAAESDACMRVCPVSE